MTDELRGELGSSDPGRRRTALARLVDAPGALRRSLVPAVVGCLATPDKRVQRLAADLLRDVPPDLRTDVIGALRAAVGSDDAAWRWGAAWALGRLAIIEPAMLPPLLDALGARDGDQRWAAAETLMTVARVHPDLVLRMVLAAAGDVIAERRKMALYVLRDLAPAEPAVRDATVRALTDAAVGVRLAALAVLIRLEPVPVDACARVLELTRSDPDAGLRRAALAALGAIGRGVNAVERAVASASASDDPAMRRAAAIARRRLDA